jgi:hypothetical protein
MRRLTTGLVIGLISAASVLGSATAGAVTLERRCRHIPASPHTLCTELLGTLQPNIPATWRIWVEGTCLPLTIRVHNSSPRALALEGGPDQIVRTSGGRRNEVLLRVTLLEPDAPSGGLKVWVAGYDPQREAAQIAAEIAPLLEALQHEFEREREVVTSGPTGAARGRTSGPGEWCARPRLGREREAVAIAADPAAAPDPAAAEALLERTKAELLDILSHQELAALRDTVEAEFRLAEAELEGRIASRPPAAPSAAILVAALAPTADMLAVDARPIGGGAGQGRVETALDRIALLLSRLVAVSRSEGLLVDLCITSKPRARAMVYLYPPSYQSGKLPTRTHRKQKVYRGLYAFAADLLGQRPIACAPGRDGNAPDSCAFLDLFNDPPHLFECDFGDGNCTPVAGPPPAGACQ